MTTTPRKAAANRRNAKKSTGPKTAKGKAASRCNALKHGLTAREVLIPGEDETELASFAASLRDHVAPAGPLEELLADRVISLGWRLRRAARVDAGLFARTVLATERVRQQRERRNAVARRYQENQSAWDAALAERTMLDAKPDEEWTDQDNERWEELAAVVERLREEREVHGWGEDSLERTLRSLNSTSPPVEDTDDHPEETGAAGVAEAFQAERTVGPLDFLQLTRYESALERGFFRALLELTRGRGSEG